MKIYDSMQNTNDEAQIIYYDLDYMDWSSISFYINGFILNQKRYSYKFFVRRSVPSVLTNTLAEGEWRRFLFPIGIFELKRGEKNFFYCIDRSDHSSMYMNQGFILPLLKDVKYYFKVNYNKEAIYSDPDLREFREKIVPAGPSFPIRIINFKSFFPTNIKSLRTTWTTRLVKKRLDYMFRIPKIETFRKKRRIKPDIDVFFVMVYYTNPNQREQNEFRYEVMRELESLKTRNIVTGFVAREKLRGKFERLRLQKPYNMKTYLHNLARSKVCIYVRGPHKGISSKFGQLLALGKPIIGESIFNNKQQLYNNRYMSEQFAYDTPREIVDNVENLLQHPQKLALLGETNAKTFDTRFAPEITSANILKKLFYDTKGGD